MFSLELVSQGKVDGRALLCFFIVAAPRRHAAADLIEATRARPVVPHPSRPAHARTSSQGDITRLEVDSVVNAANRSLLGASLHCRLPFWEHNRSRPSHALSPSFLPIQVVAEVSYSCPARVATSNDTWMTFVVDGAIHAGAGPELLEECACIAASLVCNPSHQMRSGGRPKIEWM